jgi:pseudaminic acid cytidylyltransferase
MRIAIIPARGGSKRIPNKNIKEFLGKPIIAYSIQAAIESNLFDKVVVSTDSDAIKAISLKHGAEVPFLRSEKNSDDFATTIDVILEVIKQFEEIGDKVDEACCIYATAPFVRSEELTTAYSLLVEEAYDVVFPVLPYSFPIQRAIKLDSEKKIQMFFPDERQTRSQDLEKSYHDSGQFYWFKVESVIEKATLWTDNTGVIILDEMYAHDIDTMKDWEIAEFKYRLRENG